MAFRFSATPLTTPLLRSFGEDESLLWHISGAPTLRAYWTKRSPGMPMLINGTGLHEYGALHFSYALDTFVVSYGALHFSYILGGIVEGDLSEVGNITASMTAAGTLFQTLVAASTANATSSATTGKHVDGTSTSVAAIVDATVGNQTLHTLISSSIGAAMYVRVQGAETPVWMVNTELWAATRFTNYGFDSYADIGGAYYGVTDAGLYKLAGETDDGVNIDASLMLRRGSYDSSQQKRVDRVYVHGTSDRKVEVRIITPLNDVHTYRSELELGDKVTAQRVKLGRGLIAQYWQFEVRNIAGDDLGVDKIEVVSLHTTRKIRRER